MSQKHRRYASVMNYNHLHRGLKCYLDGNVKVYEACKCQFFDIPDDNFPSLFNIHTYIQKDSLEYLEQYI